MNASSFEIIEPKVERCRTSETNRHQSFSASTLKCIPFMVASLTVAMSVVPLDSSSVENPYQPIFITNGSYQNDLTDALVSDYEVQTKLLQKLEFLKISLKENWNREGDFPIEEIAYNNAKAAIKSTPGILLKHWRLFPNPNGTLLLSLKGKPIAGISIGNEEFSYAAFVSDDKQISGKEPFNEQAFKCALMQIHRILGYD